MLPYDRRLRKHSQQLRIEMTAAEKFLWSKIRAKKLGNWFYRQKPIGIYIADFYCHKAKLVVEVDGGQHMFPQALEYDKLRDKYMRDIGVNVIRFTNEQVLTKMEEVLEKIKKKLG